MAFNTQIGAGMFSGNQTFGGINGNFLSKTQDDTYNPRYPGFNRENYEKLEKKVSELGLTGNKKQEVMDQFYRQILPQVEEEKKKSKRNEVLNQKKFEISQIKDDVQRKVANHTYTVEELAQMVKEKENLREDAPDAEVFNTWISSIPNGEELLSNYMNKGDKELLYVGGLAERPKNSFGDKVEEFAVGVAQSPGKRGYNMVGQRADKIGKGIGEGVANMLTAEQKEKVVDWLDKNTIFKRADIEEYAQELARQEAEGKTFNGRENTDITKPLLGEERADSTATRVGEIVGDIGTAIAMSYPLSSALYPAMVGGTVGEAATLGAIEGGIDTIAAQYGSQGNLDVKPLQAILGMVGGAAGGALTNKLANLGTASDKLDDLGNASKEAQISSKIADKTDDANKVAGRIGQGDIDDQAKVVKGVDSISKRIGKDKVKAIKKYEELKGAIKTTEKQIINQEDDLLRQFPDKITDWTTTETVKGLGDQVDDVTRDYLDEGIELLKKYNKNDPVATKELEMLQNTKNTEGLTRLEAKELARKLGSKLSKKFYNSNDELRNSMSAESYEQIRRGIQNAVRDRLPDDTLRNLDIEYSNLKAFEGLTDDMTEKVNTLTQKLKEVGPIEKLGRKVGDAINRVTGKGIKGLVEKFLPSNMGNKINNSIDMEIELSKNLGKLVKLNDAIDVLNQSLNSQATKSAISTALRDFANVVSDLGVNVTPVITSSTTVGYNTLDK